MSWCSWYQILTLVFCLHADGEHTPGGPKKKVTSHDWDKVKTVLGVINSGFVIVAGLIILLLAFIDVIKVRLFFIMFWMELICVLRCVCVSTLCLNLPFSHVSHSGQRQVMCHHWVPARGQYNPSSERFTSTAAPMWADIKPHHLEQFRVQIRPQNKTAVLSTLAYSLWVRRD